MGAGTSPPAGNFIAIVTVLPASVPVNVPFFTLWHEPHEPSAGSTALISAVPESVVPDWVMTQVTSSGLKESEPVPVHVPFRPDPAGLGMTGMTGLGAVATGDGVEPEPDEIDPHAASHMTRAPSHTAAGILMRSR